MVVSPRIVKREPAGCVGSYNRAFKFGLLASPKPATPSCAPFAIKNVPSGRATIHGMTRCEGYKYAMCQFVTSNHGKGMYQPFVQ